MSLEQALLGTLGSEIQPSSPLGAWVSKLALRTTVSANLGLRGSAQAAGSQVQLSSPLGQWMLKISAAADDTDDSFVSQLTAMVQNAGGMLARTPFRHWAQTVSGTTSWY